MAKEAGSLDGQAIKQPDPFDAPANARADDLVVAVVVRDRQFAHARGQLDLQKAALAIVQHHAGTGFQQLSPTLEVRIRQLGSTAQRPTRLPHPVSPSPHRDVAAVFSPAAARSAD